MNRLQAAALCLRYRQPQMLTSTDTSLARTNMRFDSILSGFLNYWQVLACNYSKGLQVEHGITLLAVYADAKCSTRESRPTA